MATEQTDTVGERLYPVPDLQDVELKLAAERMIMLGVPEKIVMGMRVAALAELIELAKADDGAQ